VLFRRVGLLRDLKHVWGSASWLKARVFIAN